VAADVFYALRVWGDASAGEVALETYRRMRKEAVQPDIITFTHLISLFSRAGRQDEALRLFAEVRPAGDHIPRSSSSSSSSSPYLISLFSRAGRQDEALRLFAEVRPAGDHIPRSSSSSSSSSPYLISLFSRAGRQDEALRLFAEVRRAGSASVYSDLYAAPSRSVSIPYRLSRSHSLARGADMAQTHPPGGSLYIRLGDMRMT
jgi:hypothetical protein